MSAKEIRALILQRLRGGAAVYGGARPRRGGAVIVGGARKKMPAKPAKRAPSAYVQFLKKLAAAKGLTYGDAMLLASKQGLWEKAQMGKAPRRRTASRAAPSRSASRAAPRRSASRAASRAPARRMR